MAIASMIQAVFTVRPVLHDKESKVYALVLISAAQAPAVTLEQFHPDCTVDPGRFAHGTALRLLAMARHVASPRLVPQANRLGLAW
ncbi:hypothetical protein D3871_17745 [Noviherbaspirillum saxi]|uniref:Uncharacterized protein n=2 Tax=Noviherbaspirillum saxi TaxID=2320863 RepID=A0A3A3G520_9BURK|nr:hypothetical protein D3871_17745 [Noviherbaspirillum saxi]